MSIDELKEGMKKSKLSLDEMLDNKNVGKTAKWQSDQQIEKPSIKDGDKKRFRTDYRSLNKPDNQAGSKYTKKMTFWMTEEVYDAFNELHAKRVIAKKKVDKGALFCEIVQWFIENEE